MRTSDEITFGQLVGSYRTLRAKISQDAFADLIGISKGCFRKWEMNRSKPSAQHLQKLLEVLLDLGVFTARKEEEEARAIWQASKVNVVFDEVWTKALVNTRHRRQPGKMGQVAADAESAGNVVESRLQKGENPSPYEISGEDIIGQEAGPMKKDRRNLTIGLIGAPMLISGMGQQDLITEVQRVLRQPSSGPGDKELKLLEQKIMLYWQARNNVVLAPADLIVHVDEYVQEVKALLDRSLLPSIRTRLCACLSQGVLLIGHSLDGMKQFQTARRYYHTAAEAAHEAKHDILQALAWYRNSRSWSYGNETNRYEQARESMLKAHNCASLGSDRAVQCVVQLGLAEVYAYLKEKKACLEALKSASRLDGYGTGDWYFIHLFDSASLNGYRGACLQQFDQPDLLEEARHALEEALSQPNTGVLRRAYCMADMAQVYAREGRVESACDSAKQVMSMADTNASLRQSLLTVRTLLEPYADVADVKDLDREMRVVLLGQQ